MTRGTDRIAFLVGAGLVRDAHLPLANELTQKLRDTLLKAAGDDKLGDGERRRAASHLALFRFLSGGIHFQEGILNRDADLPVNIEQLAVAALELQARFRNPLAPYTSGWHQRLVELEAQEPMLLAGFVEFIYSQLNEWLAFRDVHDIAYLARLADACKTTNVDIFSLNYDLCIETAFTQCDQSFANGFTPEGWRPAELNGSDCQLRLFKLHGSLDWVEDEEHGLCALRYPAHKAADDLEGMRRPLLIFGTHHKLSPREPFLSLAYQFSQRVLDTSMLVVIGYGFADDHVNEIVIQGLRRNPRLQMVVVAPDFPVFLHEHPQLSQNPRVQLLASTARDALNNGSLLQRIRNRAKEISEVPF
jgi:hypothetical protein